MFHHSEAAINTSNRDGTLLLSATEKDACGHGISNEELQPDTVLRLGYGLSGTRHLEVIDIYEQQHTGRGQPIDAGPIGYRMHATLQESVLTMLFPVPPRVRMSVQGKTKGKNGPFVPTPGLRAGGLWELDPSGDTFQLGLRVSLRCIGLLEDVS